MDSTTQPTTEPRSRVGLNAHLYSPSQTYRGAGVSRYIHNLLRYLPRIADDIEWTAFFGDPAASFDGWSARTSPWRTASPVRRIVWEQLAQPGEVRRAGLDLLHAPVYVGPLFASCPLVVTLHDLSFYRFPHLFRPFNRHYLQWGTRRTVRRAARVIAVSEWTARDAVGIFGIPRERVVAIPNGVGEDMRRLDPERVAIWRRRRGLKERFILFVGTLEPRKNITLLLRAYARLRQRGAVDHQLVIAGGKGWYYDNVFETAENLGLRDAVAFPGYVAQEDLPLWYNAADLFVYPSLYEGFGLPPLEAMACGTPAIVSNSSSLPEVVGQAGVMVDVDDEEALAKEIESLVTDRDRHRHYAEAGLARARHYTWAETARLTAQVYRRILKDL